MQNPEINLPGNLDIILDGIDFSPPTDNRIDNADPPLKEGADDEGS